ncbi:uncharacterized protein LOC129218495 [Uloborus diversus]|uniref:uncharacterized protein LOC129218495 n=1 Tax=Uloborus diversus TaxID=327109 RepID=UPI002409B6EB|nr:uncharacterized protein LOC129218495 [Uloborus diversus]
MKYCFTATQRKVFNHVVAGARQFLAELCVPGTIQEAYLLYAPCFKNISLSEEKCAPQYQRLMSMSEKVNDEPNIDRGIKESCCAFDAFVFCKHNYASQDCGNEASKFLQQHFDRITNPLLHEHCAPYMFGKGTCDVNSIARGRTISPFLTFILFLLFQKFFIMIVLIDR